MQPDLDRARSAPERYVAFISYSHQDRVWAHWLHRAIERYPIPKGLGGASRSLRPVFIDRAELPSSADLAVSVRNALEASRHLIVVCSPAAAHSRWVNEEIRIFKALGRANRILCLIVSGEPSGPRALTEGCFPPALRFDVIDGTITTAPVAEPLAADVRAGKEDRRLARTKIAAGLLGVALDQLLQREQTLRQRRLTTIATAAALGCIAFGALAAVAWLSRNEAQRERRVAEQQTKTARRTADFLRSLFEVSDPSEARGNTVTARQVLDQGAQQLDRQLRDEPLVRAELGTTLGEVYSSLGLLSDGAKLLDRARGVPGQLPETIARQMHALATIEWARGNYDQAIGDFQQALSRLTQARTDDPALRARIELGLGTVYTAKDNAQEARRHYALALVPATALADNALISQVLEGQAQVDLSAKEYDAAENGLRKALQMRIAATGELHPATAELLNELGSVEYLRGHPAGAAEYFRRTLAIDRKVLGDSHPDVTRTTNNLARVELEQRHFEQARNLLQQALEARAKEIPDTEELMAFFFSNLAIANMELGDYSQARALFERALRTAVLTKHRLHAPILTDMAELDCRTGGVADALELLSQARPIMAAAYPDDPWRSALIDNVEGGCLTAQKHYAEAARAIDSSLPVLLKKWPPTSLYGYDALARAARLYSLTDDQVRLARLKKLTAP